MACITVSVLATNWGLSHAGGEVPSVAGRMDRAEFLAPPPKMRGYAQLPACRPTPEGGKSQGSFGASCACR